MSNFAAIGGVSTTLRNLLLDRMEQASAVTVAPPDVTVSGVTGRRVNLYLYQVSENGYLKNQEIPGQGHPGDYGHPPLSLDLLYLMTTYGQSPDGENADIEAQEILGDAMRVFHEYPIVTDDLRAGDVPAGERILDDVLVGEFENVKITLQPADLEELSRIWTALPESSFRRAVTYRVSVVQIESRRRRSTALPVRRRQVYAFPLHTPQITEIVRDPPFADGPRSAVAEVGDTILILGRNLRGDSTRVVLGDTPVPAPAPQAGRIALPVPATLPAGVHLVQVVHDLRLDGEPGEPLVAHRGFESNVSPLLVIPRFTAFNPLSAGAGATLTATVAPSVTAEQEATLLIGDHEIAAQPLAADAPPTNTLTFRLPTGVSAIPAGTYLRRLRIDGAESRLTFDPVTTKYNGPNFTVT